MIIQSFTNPKVKHLVQLQQKNYRYKNQEFIAQGFKTCQSLLLSGYELKSIFFTQETYAAHQTDFDIQDVYLVTPDIMQKISTQAKTSDIVAVFAMAQNEIVATPNSALLLNIQDPGNLGTMIRTAMAMNLDALYLVDCVDIYNPKVIQSTTGCMVSHKIYQTTLPNLLPAVASIPMCALVVENGQKPQEIPLRSTILVIGNEGQGLPASVTAACAYKMTIPMPGKTESLNAAVAGSIALYLKTQSV